MFRTVSTAFVRLGVLVICLVVASCRGLSTSTTPPPTLESEDLPSRIDHLMGSLTGEESFTGAVLVARKGEILLSRGYGWAERAKKLPNSSQTRFRLGSATKQFTAMAILILQAEGQLDVQEHVCRYIAECPDAWQEITIHHLLTHTSGIPNFTGFPNYKALNATPSTPEQTIARFKDKPLDFKPGAKWRYSNSGYILLGHIIERASGQSYETYLQEHIFEPLHMTGTGYDHNDGSLAIGYTGTKSRWKNADYADMSIPYAAGGLFSTAEDLYRWDRALYAGQFVPQDLLDEMFTPHVKTTNRGESYGYGWFIGEMSNHRVVSHGGSIEGFMTEIRRYVDDQVTIIVLSNRDTTDVRAVADQIAKLVFGE